MHSRVILIQFFVIFYTIWEIDAHGRLMTPPGRSSAWRKGFDTPKNYNDNQLYCGGFSVQHFRNRGNCGPCGDNYSDRRPRENENGGKYGTGKKVQRYRQGQRIKLQVEITANHKGYFEFSLCPLNSTMDLETEECFDANPIQLKNGKTRYPVRPEYTGFFDITAQLPPNVTCEHCVLRWHYHCGNNWGICEDKVGRIGCGPQETFRSCSDVTIDSDPHRFASQEINRGFYGERSLSPQPAHKTGGKITPKITLKPVKYTAWAPYGHAHSDQGWLENRV